MKLIIIAHHERKRVIIVQTKRKLFDEFMRFFDKHDSLDKKRLFRLERNK